VNGLPYERKTVFLIPDNVDDVSAAVFRSRIARQVALTAPVFVYQDRVCAGDRGVPVGNA